MYTCAGAAVVPCICFAFPSISVLPAAATASLAQTEAAAQRCANGGKAPTATPTAAAAPPAFSAFFVTAPHLTISCILVQQEQS
jgi:hypothetical protein